MLNYWRVKNNRIIITINNHGYDHDLELRRTPMAYTQLWRRRFHRGGNRFWHLLLHRALLQILGHACVKNGWKWPIEFAESSQTSWPFHGKLSKPGWWFGTFFIFPYIGNNHPKWLIFFRGVETTNQLQYSIISLHSDLRIGQQPCSNVFALWLQRPRASVSCINGNRWGLFWAFWTST